LAEDSLVNQKLALGLLEKQGHSVVVANTGKEAVAAAQTQSFDLVLMDVQMPEMDGLEATRTIRAGERTTGNRVPIMAMTAHAMQGDRERCLAAGMDEYIAKPIRAKALFEKIQRTFGTTKAAPVTSPPEAGSTKAVNWSEALAAVGGDQALLKDVAAAFLEECPRQLSAIQQAVQNKDSALLRRAAHTIKSSLRLFGANVGYENAFRLETMGHDGKTDSAGEPLAILESELHRITPVLTDYVRRGAQS
jgi:CheY-like chemotaxis protein